MKADPSGMVKQMPTEPTGAAADVGAAEAVAGARIPREATAAIEESVSAIFLDMVEPLT